MSPDPADRPDTGPSHDGALAGGRGVEGAPGAPLDAGFDAAYDDLRRIARALVRRHGSTDTLNATALVHEAFLRLDGPSGLAARDRGHLLALAARAMRFVLVDHARARTAAKRGAGTARVSLDEAHAVADLRADELLALDEALTALADDAPRLADVVELRFFGGLTYEEVGGLLDVSVRTAKRDWEMARAWLHRTLHPDTPDAAP